MPSFIRIRIRVLLALALVTFLWSRGVEAQLGGCTTMDGEPRECTLSENWGSCMDATWDAFWQCVERAEVRYGKRTFGYAVAVTSCELWLAADQTACFVTARRTVTQ